MQYYLWPFLKVQVLVDFILECIILNWEDSKVVESSKKEENPGSSESSRGEEVDMGSDPEELWTLRVDGSSSATWAGVGLILISLEGEAAGYALCFDFSTTNNEVEYEALLSGLQVARELRAQYLKVFSDS